MRPWVSFAPSRFQGHILCIVPGKEFWKGKRKREGDEEGELAPRNKKEKVSEVPTPHIDAPITQVEDDDIYRPSTPCVPPPPTSSTRTNCHGFNDGESSSSSGQQSLGSPEGMCELFE